MFKGFGHVVSVVSRDSILAREKLGKRVEAAALERSLANPLLKLESVIPLRLVCRCVLDVKLRPEFLRVNRV